MNEKKKTRELTFFYRKSLPAINSMKLADWYDHYQKILFIGEGKKYE